MGGFGKPSSCYVWQGQNLLKCTFPGLCWTCAADFKRIESLLIQNLSLFFFLYDGSFASRAGSQAQALGANKGFWGFGGTRRNHGFKECEAAAEVQERKWVGGTLLENMNLISFVFFNNWNYSQNTIVGLCFFYFNAISKTGPWGASACIWVLFL